MKNTEPRPTSASLPGGSKKERSMSNTDIKRGYGRMFLNSLPDVPVTAAPADEIQISIADFFAKTEES